MRAFRKFVAVMLVLALTVIVIPKEQIFAKDVSATYGGSYYKPPSTTLDAVNTYGNSYTKSSKTTASKNLGVNTALYSQSKKTQLFKLGKSLATPGVKNSVYNKIMTKQWYYYGLTGNFYNVQLKDVDISEKYTYTDIVDSMYEMTRIPGVYLFEIGSTQGGNGQKSKDMYVLEIDCDAQGGNGANPNKNTVIITAGVHARETANPVIVLKQITDMLNAYEKNDSETVAILKTTRFVVICCCNPDGYNGIIENSNNKKWKYSNGQYWKANGKGTDIGRNFPGLAWGQVKYSNVKNKTAIKTNSNIGSSSSKLGYPGPSAASASETQAIMKVLYYYIVADPAAKTDDYFESYVLLVDYHSQGREIYSGKTWLGSDAADVAENVGKYVANVMNAGVSSNKYKYVKEDKNYDLDGTGSTLTDYGVSLGIGAKHSSKYGFMVFEKRSNRNKLSAEIPLIRVQDLQQFIFDNGNSYIVHKDYTGYNFWTVTLETCMGSDALGGTTKARSLAATEYDKYNYGKLLKTWSDLANGIIRYGQF